MNIKNLSSNETFWRTVQHRGWFGQLILHVTKSWKIDQKTRSKTDVCVKFHAATPNFAWPRVSSHVLQIDFQNVHKLENTQPRKIFIARVFSSYFTFYNFFLQWNTVQNIRAHIFLSHQGKSSGKHAHTSLAFQSHFLPPCCTCISALALESFCIR